MSHKDIYKWFELYFPDYAGDKVDTWFPDGKGGIRVRQKTVRNLYLRITTNRTGILRR